MTKKYVNIIDRIYNWSAARYEPVHTAGLAGDLLGEEIEEGLHAIEYSGYVGLLDSAGDTFFVAIGNLYKLGVSAKSVKALHSYFSGSYCESFKNTYADFYLSTNDYAIADVIDEASDKHAALLNCFSAYGVAAGLLGFVNDRLALLDTSRAITLNEVVEAICTSNETKATPTEKVNPAVKANKIKGVNYVPPTAALTALVKRSPCR